MSEVFEKCAEMYRSDCGNFYYCCYHCGEKFDSASRTRKHVTDHFILSKFDDDEMDEVDEKIISELKIETLDENDENIFCPKSADTMGTTDLPTSNKYTDNKANEQSIITFADNCETAEQSGYEYDYEIGEIEQSSLQSISADCVELLDNGNSAGEDRQTNRPLKQLPQPWFGCGPCSLEFKTKSGVRHHNVKYHPEKFAPKCESKADKSTPWYGCKLCAIVFKTESGVRHHNKKYHPQLAIIPNATYINCDICSKEFVRVSYFRLHMKWAHGDNRYDAETFNCDICSKMYFTKQTIRVHMMQCHSNNDSLTEVGPARRQRRYKKVNANAEVISPREQYNCIECPNVFTDQKTFQKHLIDVHKSVDFLTKCEYCEKVFKTKHLARQHTVEQHSNDKPYQCNECGRVFATYRQLRKHMEFHNERNFVCRKCGKAFKTNGTLRHHEKLHMRREQHAMNPDTPKEYCCDICGKEYNFRVCSKI